MGKKEDFEKMMENAKMPKLTENDIIIIAPHPDDELIGCWSVVSHKELKPIIIYTADFNEDRKIEALKIKEMFRVKAQLFLKNIPGQFLSKENIFFFPDPTGDTHPDHRVAGMMGEDIARKGGTVIFYSTEMNVPYKYVLNEQDRKDKQAALNEIYPSQSDLWKYEKKYVIFEGFNQWLFPDGLNHIRNKNK